MCTCVWFLHSYEPCMMKMILLLLDCSNPKPVIKAIVDVPDSLTEGAKAKYTCPPRYKLVGNNILTCKNGKWTGVLPHCRGMMLHTYVKFM